MSLLCFFESLTRAPWLGWERGRGHPKLWRNNSIRLVRGVCWGVQGSQSPGWLLHLEPLSASILCLPFQLQPSLFVFLLLPGFDATPSPSTPLSGPQPPHLVPCSRRVGPDCLQAWLLQLASFGSLLTRPFVKQINVTDYWYCSLVNMFHGKLAIGSELPTSLEE